MRQRVRNVIIVSVLAFTVAGALPARAADSFTVDGVHSSVTFKIQHMGISWIHGRFNDVSGTFTLDKEKSTFELTIKSESIDTNNKQRDEHLRSPDFFNVKQFPQIAFKSTSVKVVDGGYEVTGDLTMHGVTKSITFTLKGGKETEFPPGMKRTGFTTDLTIKRADFGIDKFPEMLGAEVPASISFEGTKK
jgi:polyisoprenoid-binding protein YceI